MSINFNDIPNELSIQMMRDIFGEPTASDGKTNLFDKLPEIESRLMKELANASGQPVSVEMNIIGDRKTMKDGSQWQLGPSGWYKIAL